MSRPKRSEASRGGYKLVEREGQVLEQVHLEESDGEVEGQLVRKIDRRIMPMLFAMIVFNYLDRNSFANARVQGMETSLGLQGAQFNTAISIFFVGYIGLQIPSNLLITRVRPSVYLPACMIAWGFLSGITAFVRGYRALLTVRFLLGLVEAPFFPGAVFFLSSWYTKRELALRTAILYSGGLLSGAFGGLIGATIESCMHGVLGLDSWRWLFLIEASCTIVLAASAMFVLPDYPHTTSAAFLTQREQQVAVSRLSSGGVKDASHSGVLKGLRMAIADYKVWLLGLIIITKTSASAVTSFIPTLVDTLGLARVQTLLLIAPPYVISASASLLISRMSDRRGERALHIAVPMCVAICGFAVAALTLNTLARYVSLFLMLSGVYGSYNVSLAWISSCLPTPPEKRSAAIAMINTMGNVAQIYSPYFYLPEQGPRYVLAMIANMCFCVLCIVITMILRSFLIRENDKLDRDELYLDEEDFKDRFRYTL